LCDKIPALRQDKIIAQLRDAFTEVSTTVGLFPEALFFQRPATGKWSAAENAEHLFLSVKPLAGLFHQPGIMSEKWGTSSRPSGNYDAVVALYLEKVGNVGAGFPAFIPGNITSSKQELVDKLEAVNNKFLIQASLLTEKELDTYHVPHPLIGMLTCREFLYFTHYHTQRHCAAMKRILAGFGA
jgi:hypothetical protein